MLSILVKFLLSVISFCAYIVILLDMYRLYLTTVLIRLIICFTLTIIPFLGPGEAAVQRCSYEKVSRKYTVNLQEKTHAQVRFQ